MVGFKLSGVSPLLRCWLSRLRRGADDSRPNTVDIGANTTCRHHGADIYSRPNTVDMGADAT